MDILGIYVMKMKNPMLASLNKFLPFPAMKIESTYISYYTFVHDTEKLQKISSIRFNNPMWYESLKSDENIFQRYELLNILRKKYSLSVDNDIAKNDDQIQLNKVNSTRVVPAILTTLANNHDMSNKVDIAKITTIVANNDTINDWSLLIKTVNSCIKCDLSKNKQNVVIERGNRNAKWMFIGEINLELICGNI